MVPYYERDGKWYVFGFCERPDIGPLSSESDARIVHEAMIQLYDDLKKQHNEAA